MPAKDIEAQKLAFSKLADKHSGFNYTLRYAGSVLIAKFTNGDTEYKYQINPNGYYNE